MAKIRWGLLSTAHINRVIIPAIRASQRGELVAVASRDLARAQEYASRWEIPDAFGSYQEMLASDKIDAVYISLPNHLHAEWSVRAMQAGKHVLCEKPLALSVEEVDRMIAARQTSGNILAEAFMYLHHPQTTITRQLLLEGRLGEVCSLNAVFNFKVTDPNDIRLVPEYGGGSLWDVGIYPVSLAMTMLGGTPEWVAASQWLGSSGVDEHFSGLLSFSEDRQAQVVSSFRSPYYTSAEIFGTDGCLTMNRPFVGIGTDQKLIFHPAHGEPQEIPVPEKMLYLGEVEDMHAAILDGTPQLIPLERSRQWIGVLSSLYRAANQRSIVAIK